MSSNANGDQDNLDLAQVNRLTDDHIDAMSAEEAKKLLKRLRTIALFHLVGEALQARNRELEMANTNSTDPIGRTRAASFPTM